MTRYHIGKDGNPHVCRAQEGDCPLGGEHYGSFRECERASEKSFQHTMGRITSRKKKKEILRNLPNDDYVRVFRDYALQYQRNGQGRERPFIVKKDGVVYAITKIDRDGKEQYAMSLNPEFMQEGESFGMVPLEECYDRNDELGTYVEHPIYFSLEVDENPEEVYKDEIDRLIDPVQEQSGPLMAIMVSLSSRR